MKKNLAVITVSLFFTTTVYAYGFSVPDWAEGQVDCENTVILSPKEKISRGDLEKLRKYFLNAVVLINSARQAAAHEDVSDQICVALYFAYLGDLSKEELRTSGEELHKLQIQGWKSQFKKYLKNKKK